MINLLKQILYSVFFCLPVFLLVKTLIWYFKEKQISYFFVGMICGSGIGLYLSIASNYLLFKLFLADIIFHINLFITSFIYSLFYKLFFNSILPSPDKQEFTFLISMHFIIIVILYGALGTFIGTLLDIMNRK